MDVHQLRVFLAVYGKRSFSRASDALNLSQPTISDHIKNLENELGCRLFDRLGRSILPTAEAEQLVPKAAEIVERLDAIPGSLRREETSFSGLAVLGASTIPGTYWLPRRMAEFRSLHPDVRFEVRVGDTRTILEGVETHDYLVGVIGARVESSRVDSLAVASDELVLAAPPGMSLPKRLSIPDLGKIPFLLREAGSGTRRVMEAHLAEQGVSLRDLNVVGVLGSTEAVKQAIIEGLGASIISRQAAALEEEAGKIRVVTVAGLRMQRQFHLIRHRKRSLPPLYEAVFAFLAREMERGPAQ